MSNKETEQLAKSGWKEVSAADFLGLSPEEEAIVETSLILSRLVRESREARGWTQKRLAEHLGKKQPQIVRLETGAGISFEAQFAALYQMGVQPRAIADALMQVSLKSEQREPAEELTLA